MKQRHHENPAIAITVGDCNGVGPEVVLKSIAHPAVRRMCRPVLVGPSSVFLYYAERLNVPLEMRRFLDIGPLPKPSSVVPLVETSPLPRSAITPGKISETAGATATAAIEKAVRLVLTGVAAGMVTAPVSKLAMAMAGVAFPGQTEMLQRLTSSPHVAMMLVSATMRVGLVTIHIPINKVSETISRALLRERIEVVHEALRNDWLIRKPKLAVLGLNPHAGEGGGIGTEDQMVIEPVIRELRSHRLSIEGPFPADSFFGRYEPNIYDAVIAMYHDQGLIPLKMSSFGAAVNVSAGLNIVRTSPDHGTAFDIAGKGIAKPDSMIEAIKAAATNA
ncbi:MAG: 4-hydroxythreonine-4-phosphate dehydrogenase PdxA [Ignavibacteriae bacterium]|nr:4-hydroxythreonine-4-phosphate dehydrogenase PdxA [Ignavibacteriota bacterium]